VVWNSGSIGRILSAFPDSILVNSQGLLQIGGSPDTAFCHVNMVNLGRINLNLGQNLVFPSSPYARFILKKDGDFNVISGNFILRSGGHSLTDSATINISVNTQFIYDPQSTNAILNMNHVLVLGHGKFIAKGSVVMMPNSRMECNLIVAPIYPNRQFTTMIPNMETNSITLSTPQAKFFSNGKTYCYYLHWNNGTITGIDTITATEITANSTDTIRLGTKLRALEFLNYNSPYPIINLPGDNGMVLIDSNGKLEFNLPANTTLPWWTKLKCAGELVNVGSGSNSSVVFNKSFIVCKKINTAETCAFYLNSLEYNVLKTGTIITGSGKFEINTGILLDIVNGAL
jgi:hypothetical protein